MLVKSTEFILGKPSYYFIKHKKTELQLQFGFIEAIWLYILLLKLVHAIHAAWHSTWHCWSFVFFLFN
jgi:hypothetical protein